MRRASPTLSDRGVSRSCLSSDHFFTPQVKKTSEILTALEHRELKNLSDDDSDDDAPSTSKKGKGKANSKLKLKGKATTRLAPEDDDEFTKGVDAGETPFERFVRLQQGCRRPLPRGA